MTQLGLIPSCEPEHYFHFPSRIAGRFSLANLTELTAQWLRQTFGQTGEARIAPKPQSALPEKPCATLSLGVGENESKRVPGDFEARLIEILGQRFRFLFIDRGAGGEESRRVTAAVEASGAADRVRFAEGSFASFAALIGQSDFYAGYDSAGQHAAAAAGVPLVSVFAGAPSDTFRARWAPRGPGPVTVLNAGGLSREKLLEKISAAIPLPFGEKEE
jgi:ADP-heptose:LPS heptosyltransferase